MIVFKNSNNNTISNTNDNTNDDTYSNTNDCIDTDNNCIDTDDSDTIYAYSGSGAQSAAQTKKFDLAKNQMMRENTLLKDKLKRRCSNVS